MGNQNTTLDDHSDLSRRLLQQLESFIDEAGDRNCTAHLDSVLDDGKYLKGRNLAQEPERFVEDHLIFPVLRELGHSVRPRPTQYAPRWPKRGGVPDFALTTVPVNRAKDNELRLFGESKPLNKLHYAQNDVEDYLNTDLDFHAVVLLTDGIDWELWLRRQNQSLKEEYKPYASASLKPALKAVRGRNKRSESYSSYEVRQEIDASSFNEFVAPTILDTIRSEIGIGIHE